MTKEFLNDLTELAKKHNIVLNGAGVYYGVGFRTIEKVGDGFYQITPENEECIEWISTI